MPAQPLLAAGTDETCGSVEIQILGREIVCDRSGAAYLPQSRTLIVSDMHLEKGAAFARRGMMLPPYDTAMTLDRLEAVMRRYRPALVISLGDSFHDRWGAAQMPGLYEARLRSIIGTRDWCWITGNHDPERPADLPGESAETLSLDGLTFRHEPSSCRDAGAGEVAGHLHPVARVLRRGAAVRRPCFAADGRRLLMPAFGATTGGLDLRHRAMNGLFDRGRLFAHLLGRDRVYTVRFTRLSG